MLQRRMFRKLRVVPNDGEEIARQTGADEKISKKALENISEAFLRMAVQAVFLPGGSETFSIKYIFCKTNK